MPQDKYRYKALDPKGGDVAGAVSAASEADAIGKLAARGLSAYAVQKDAPSPFAALAARGGVRNADLCRFLRQFATLLSANVSLLEALGTLGRARAHPVLAERARDVAAGLRAGKRLSAMLEECFPDFPPYVVRLADLGEATGSLSKALSDAADRMEYDLKVKADLQSALTYPLFLLTFGGAIIVLMFMFVVPRFATLLGPGLENAPAMSRVIIGAGLWLRENALLAASAAALAVGGGIAASRNDAARDAVRVRLRSG